MRTRWGGALAALIACATQPAAAQSGQPSRDPVFDSAAVAAWAQFNRLWIPATGLAKATPDYEMLTPWDMGSVLAAVYSARVLGLIDEAEYLDRARRTLRTLEQIRLFQNVAFHKLYNARSATMTSRSGGRTTRGHAWSATDLGRLLIWLRIVAASDSGLSRHVAEVVQRLKFERIVADGYMYGEELTRRGRIRRFQEGRIGYEQYAARGFDFWGQEVANALDINRHARRVQVLGVELLADARGLDRLVSEPFVLAGLETGWMPHEDTLAWNLLDAQRQRYQKTGVITIASEDAVGVAPHYFYYYCVYCNGKPFVVDVADPGKTLDSPRWVSTKAAFAWHALLPSEYTLAAIERVSRARTPAGWSSGVYERTGRPTRTYDVNTAAVILEAAAYHRVGGPLLGARISATAR